MKKIILCLSLFIVTNAFAEMNDDVKFLQTRWAEIKYSSSSDSKQTEYDQLLEKANSLIAANKNNPEFLIWHGIVESSYAGSLNAINPFALKFVFNAKDSLEKAIEINPQALSGSAYTSMAVLYAKVPGFPLGFGDSDKAEDFFRKSLEINPEGIDPNFLYAEFLFDEDRKDEAKKYLQKALEAQPRPGREVADAGRMNEVKELLRKIK